MSIRPTSRLYQPLQRFECLDSKVRSTWRLSLTSLKRRMPPVCDDRNKYLDKRLGTRSSNVRPQFKNTSLCNKFSFLIISGPLTEIIFSLRFVLENSKEPRRVVQRRSFNKSVKRLVGHCSPLWLLLCQELVLVFWRPKLKCAWCQEKERIVQ